jgi:hypothetical protein
MVGKFKQDRGHELGIKRTQKKKKNLKRKKPTTNPLIVNKGINPFKMGESVQQNQPKTQVKMIKVFMNLVTNEKAKG